MPAKHYSLGMGVGSGGQGGRVPPWIFIYCTDIVERGLILLFFGLFSVGPPRRSLIVLFFCFFSGVPSPRNFSADALESRQNVRFRYFK